MPVRIAMRTQGAPRIASTLGCGVQRRWRKNQIAVDVRLVGGMRLIVNIKQD
jgi:hypothetical protein